MSLGLMNLINTGHSGFYQSTDERVKNSVNQNDRSFIGEWKNCDGFGRDVPTALLARSISCMSSILLLIMTERVKLLFYQ